MMAKVEEAARADVQHLLRHGLSRQEVQGLLLAEFRNADLDHSGFLTRAELKKSLPVSKLGLTRKDINLLMSQPNVNNDASISYEEFVPLCVQILEERFEDEIIVNEVLQSEDCLQQTLVGPFQEADPEETGLLHPQKVQAVLQKLSYQILGLSTFQISALIQQAPKNGGNLIIYLKFVPVAAAMIYSMYSMEGQQVRLQAIQQLSNMGGAAALVGRDLDELKETLVEAFDKADCKGTGQLSYSQVMEIIQQTATRGPRPFTSAEVENMLDAMDLDQTGIVKWKEFVNCIVDMLEHVEREAFLLLQFVACRS